MLLFNRILPFLSTVLLVITLEVWFLKPEWSWVSAATVMIICFVTVWSLTRSSFLRKLFWDLFINPAVFLIGTVVFFLLIDDLFVRQLFIAGVAVGYYLVLYSMFTFLYQTKSYQPYALEYVSSYLNLTSLFLLATGSYGFSILLGWPAWLSTVIMFLVALFLFYRTLLAHKIPWRVHWFVVLIIALLIAQAYYVVSFLPTSYLFNGLLVTVVYYLLTNCVSEVLAKTIERQTIKRYIVVSIIVTVLAFLTTRWV